MKRFLSKKRAPKKTSYGLRFWLSISLLAVLATCVMIIAKKNTQVLKENKEKDVWAIVYLEVEKMARDIEAGFPSIEKLSVGRDRASSVYKIRGNRLNLVSGGGKEKLDLERLGFKKADFRTGRKYVVKLDGKTYRLHFDKGLLTLYQLEAPWLATLGREKDDLTLYILNRAGQLVGTNDQEVVSARERQLVQKFILNPLSQGQQRFKKDGVDTIGFFYEIEGTNLVLFAEAELALLAEEVWQIYRELLVYAVLVMFIGILLLQWPLSKMLAPLADLKRLTAEIAKGQFDIVLEKKGSGELAELATAFTSMGKALVIRDEKIKTYIEEEKNSLRLKNELAITSNIQANFLPTSSWQKEDSGLEIAARYIPADEAAGDWYHYYFDEKNQETVVVVADVSGHGAGAAMFTAVIASTFERYKDHSENSFPVQSYLKETNSLIYRLGKRAWHATMLVLVHKKSSMCVYNAGHQRPLIYKKSEEKLKGVKVIGPVLGLEPEVEFTRQSVFLKPGDYILAFSDGLVESKSPSGKHFTPKKMKKTFSSLPNADADKLAAQLEQDWRIFIDGVPPDDDTCFVTLRACA